jgi:hypothetical protein
VGARPGAQTGFCTGTKDPRGCPQSNHITVNKQRWEIGGAFPVCRAGFQQMSPDCPSVMSQKSLYKIQTTPPPRIKCGALPRSGSGRGRLHPPPSTRSVCTACGEKNLAIPSASPSLSKIPPPLWREWEGQKEILN